MEEAVTFPTEKKNLDGKIHLESRRQELFFARRDDSSVTLVQQPSGYLLKRMLDTLPPSTLDNGKRARD